MQYYNAIGQTDGTGTGSKGKKKGIKIQKQFPSGTFFLQRTNRNGKAQNSHQ